MTSPPEIAVGGYVALFALTVLAWGGVPVAGQAAVVAGGVLSGHDRMELQWVLVAAAVGSAGGGALGYWIGVHSGRLLAVERGPLRRWRQRELARGQRLFDRYGHLAVFVAPMWVAGVCRMRWRRFLPWNLAAALAWTLVCALGGYWAGPSMIHGLGLVNAALCVAAMLALALSVAYLHRRGRDRRP